jgi:ketosteroid isomerase-like protein
VASPNVELVRSIFGAWERGDYSSADWADREIEYVVVDGPEPGSWQGKPGMAASWRAYIGNWQDARAQAEEYLELPDERVLVLTRWIGRGKTSGLQIGIESGQLGATGANLFHCRDGKVTRLLLYFDRRRALADLGLAEATRDLEPDG